MCLCAGLERGPLHLDAIPEPTQQGDPENNGQGHFCVCLPNPGDSSSSAIPAEQFSTITTRTQGTFKKKNSADRFIGREKGFRCCPCGV